MNEAQRRIAGLVPRLVLVPLRKFLCPCPACARMGGFYQVVWELPPGLPAEQMQRMAKHSLFGKVICAN